MSFFVFRQRIGGFIAAALVANGLWSISKPVDVGYKKRFKRISSKAAFPSQRVGKVLAKETKDLLDAFSPSSEVLVGVRPDGVTIFSDFYHNTLTNFFTGVGAGNFCIRVMKKILHFAIFDEGHFIHAV